MKRTFIKTAMAVVCAASFAGLATSAFAQDSALGKKVNLYLKDADLLTATRMLSQQTGLKFVVAPSEKQYAKINLSLEDVSAEDAIVYICQAAGGFAERDQNGVFVIRFGANRPSQMEVAPTINTESEEVIKTLQVKKMDPRDILEMIKTGDAYDVDRMYKDMWNIRSITDPNAHTIQTMKDVVTPMFNHLSNPSSMPGTMGNNGLVLPSGTDPQGRGGGGGGAQGGGLAGGGIGGGQGGGLAGGGIGGGQAGGGGGGSFQGVTGGQGLVPSGTTSLGYNPSNNTLIFRGTPEAYNQLLAVLDQLDVAPKQLIVKLEYITTTNTLDKSLGIDWYYERGGTFAGVRPGSFAQSTDPVFLNYATGNVATRLRALLTDGWGRVVTAPLVRTFNNQSATMSASTTTWFFLTQSVATAAGIVTTTTPIPISIQTNLSVRPRINGDNTITMILSPTVSNITGFQTGPDGTQVPNFVTQSIFVAIRVKDGETIALGGLTAKNDTFTQSRIPLLSDLPIIGQLFRTRRSNQATSELIIFVTAKIIDENQSGLGIP